MSLWTACTPPWNVDEAQVVIIDSLNGFMNAMPGEKYLPMQLHELTTFLNQKGSREFSWFWRSTA